MPSHIAKRRWGLLEFKPGGFLRKRRHIFELRNGETFTVIDASDATIDAIEQLPLDYFELGNYTSDEVNMHAGDLRQAKTYAEAILAENRMLKQRIAAAPEAERIVPVLAADLERSINMMMRFAQSLGIIPQGPIYEAIQELASRYGMTYRGPNEDQIVSEAFARDVLGADVITAELDEEAGRLEFAPAPGATIDGASNDAKALPTGDIFIEDDGDPC